MNKPDDRVWIWFPRDLTRHFQDDTEPKLFPERYEKFVPRSRLDDALRELARLKTSEQLLSEPLKLDHLNEMIRRLKSWGYHVSQGDQFKEMELQREIDALLLDLAKERSRAERLERMLEACRSQRDGFRLGLIDWPLERCESELERIREGEKT